MEKFVGSFVEYDQLAEREKVYVLCTELTEGSGEWAWMLPETDAKYANHSCDPNCFLNDNRELVTLKSVGAGQELTFYYNHGTEDDFWDPLWTFKCYCGAKQCQGMIDRYRLNPNQITRLE